MIDGLIKKRWQTLNTWWNPVIEQIPKMCSKKASVQTFMTHLHARQDKPALDFKMDFITTDW